tara:strand:+ start:13445 stop:14347 length:903 start_codon:yes stop_codon:yes gene_type:complete
MSVVKRTIAQMKTPLDRVLEARSQGKPNPDNIEELCVLYGNIKYLRCFDRPHGQFLIEAVQSGSIQMLKIVLKCKPTIHILTSQALIESVSVGNIDVFKLMYPRAIITLTPNSRLMVEIIKYDRYDMYLIHKTEAIIQPTKQLWFIIVKYNAVNISKNLPTITFDAFKYCLSIIALPMLYAIFRPEFIDTSDKLHTVIVELTSNPNFSDFIPFLEENDCLHEILTLYHCQLIAATKYIATNHPHLIKRDHIIGHIMANDYATLQILCKVHPVDIDLLITAIDNKCSLGILQLLANKIKDN